MSRYIFKGYEPGLNIVVGWDNPLETYFAQVLDGCEPEDADIRLWTGTITCELTTVEALNSILAPYGEIPPAVLAQLRDDPHVNVPPTALQRSLRK